MPIEEVIELLKEENILPGTVNTAILKNIKAINHCRVTWEYFSTKPGPMQCKRCQLFGHGTSNCNRIKKCYLCAGEHDPIICPQTAGPAASDGRVPEHKLKCANCGGNHTARFLECPKNPVLPNNPTHRNPAN
uniref:Pre-C2HC domain-containing protein n=1 Tax=Anopheles funestus TaxID=62324 RepID=A0A182S0D1_ANOFN